MRKAHRETADERTTASERLVIGRHGGSSDDVAPSADSEPVEWNANVIAAISRRNIRRARIAWGLIPAMPRREERYGAKLTAVSTGRMLGMSGGSVLHLDYYPRFNDALVNREA